MNKYLRYIPHLFLGLIIFFIFKSWFSLDLITAGDFWPYAKSQYETKTLFLYAWNLAGGSGMGGFVGPFLWIYLNFGIPLTIFGGWLGLSWEIIQRIYYLFPFIILSLFSSYKLFSKLFPNNRFAVLSSAIYLLNTYILMVIGGGQIPGVAVAYSILPFSLYVFINVFEKIEEKPLFKAFNYSLIASLVLSLQLLFDIRIAYITLIAVLIYWIIKNMENKNIKFLINSFIFVFLVPGIFSVLLHAFWIIPTIASLQNPVEQLGFAYSSLDAVKFLSFAKFENSISLLHPNWPDNIFGKTEFMRPEFLLLPILAFASLFFIKSLGQKAKIYVLYFALLGLIGAFLAKGANEPFGNIYLWMFNHVPGFIMFRDPSKWYTLVAISYSILIPFSVWKIYEWLKSHSRFKIYDLRFMTKNRTVNLQNLFILLLISYLLFLIRPALFGQLSGTFKTTQIPQDYIKLEKFLSSQNSFSRTLWIPTTQRFGYYSNSHPAIPAQNYFKTVNKEVIIKKIKNSDAQKLLSELSVKYIIIPYDSQGEIFLKDRIYDEKIYQTTVRKIDESSWLKRMDGFGKIKVFEVSNPKDHFYISNQQSAISNQKITYQYISPVEYKLEVKNAKIGDKIIFSENYDASWIARDSETKFYDWPNLIGSNPYERRFNSFTLRKGGDYSMVIYYYPQIIVNTGMAISGLSLVLILGALIYLRKKKK